VSAVEARHQRKLFAVCLKLCGHLVKGFRKVTQEIHLLGKIPLAIFLGLPGEMPQVGLKGLQLARI
jgi:hypothetical protein